MPQCWQNTHSMFYAPYGLGPNTVQTKMCIRFQILKYISFKWNDNTKQGRGQQERECYMYQQKIQNNPRTTNTVQSRQKDLWYVVPSIDRRFRYGCLLISVDRKGIIDAFHRPTAANHIVRGQKCQHKRTPRERINMCVTAEVDLQLQGTLVRTCLRYTQLFNNSV